ncbi:unnamed protein product [Paramecium sonneborni]|uniref:Uncharacterized protein n=1 Tax=Paramecium sonneborni TaxID=65129 RepID=A0A8S1LD21_9CILI|nr:unnamed protein product [Paramecium sonneborni]
MDDLAAMDARIQMVNDDNTFLRKQLQGKNEQFLQQVIIILKVFLMIQKNKTLKKEFDQ